MRDALLRGVALRGRILLDLMASEPCDLFFGVFAETHCAGHQFWHLHDAGHPRHRTAPPALRSALRDVYAAVDRAIAALVERAGPAARVMIFSAHGMRPQYHGRELLPVLLEWWGMNGRDNVAPDPRRGRTVVAHRPALDAIRQAIPLRWQYVVKRRLPQTIERRLLSRFIAGPRAPSRARAACMPNNDLNPAIRISLVGRDPNGVVPPGDAHRALRNFLLTRMRELINPATGRPALEHVTTIQEQFAGPYRDRLPDLSALWSSERPITALYSPGYGTVLGSHHDQRTGGHAPEGFLALSGIGVLPTQLRNATAADVAPTVLSLLDVPVPHQMCGRSLVGTN